MQKYIGKSISKGIAIGKIYFHSKGDNLLSRNKIEDPDGEIKRYMVARDTAISQLRDIYEDAINKDSIKSIIIKIFKTKSGIDILNDLYI